jgi:5-methylthioadenosine/S-adenosylhomocysteine deaminase
MDNPASLNFSSHALCVWQKGSQFILVVVISKVRRAIVSLMDRPNIEPLIVAGNVRKWKGQLLDVDLPNPRRQLKASRDYVFAAACVAQDLFRSQ